MKVRDILESKGTHVWTIQETATILDVLGLLTQHRIGALVVLDKKDQVVGIITERDIIHQCQKDSKHVETTSVKDVMSRKLIIGHMDDAIDYIMGVMTNNRIRHIPIMTGSKLEGMISIGDVVKAELQDQEYENKYLKDYMFGSQPET